MRSAAVPARVERDVVLATDLTKTSRFGVIASLALLAIGLVWMQVTMISGAVIASGQAVVSGKPKMVQSLDGGVVEEIFVKDGDLVQAGDPLLKLDPTLLLINRDIYRNRLAEVTARGSRLEAEYLGAAEITRQPPPLELEAAALDRHYQGQQSVFVARQDVLMGKKEQLEERVQQFKNQISGVEGQITSTKDQLAFVDKQLETLVALSKDGLARESEVLNLQREQSGLLGQLSQLQSELARVRNSIRDTELEVLQADRQFKEDVVTELREAVTEREELVLQIITVEKQLARVEIAAPSDGIVHELQVNTVGGVVPAEEVIVQIIPQGNAVEFEIRVDTKSIDQIFVGQKAKVSFPAFDMRTIPEIFGTVAEVPPSSVTDERTGQSYYRVRLEVAPQDLALLGDVEMIPGMPIEAFLETGERSVLSYLTKPLTDQLGRAFREG
ncbi:MAG: HlyD family type I secretion periplasmic adaptor subunit [Tabrizicola sp.]|nr:HlyD family type I secretion periplasmic adaptor subunit [Tabrizicola sp.]